MALEKVSNKFSYLKYSQCTKGQVLAEGIYLGHVTDQYGKPAHRIRNTDTKEITVLNSSGHLNYLLENNVSQGDYIQVAYDGTEIQTKGKFKGKESHRFELAIDKEASEKGAGTSYDDDEDDSTPVASSKSAESQIEDEDDVATPTPKAAPTPIAAVKAAPKVDVPAPAKQKRSAEDILADFRKQRA